MPTSSSPTNTQRSAKPPARWDRTDDHPLELSQRVWLRALGAAQRDADAASAGDDLRLLRFAQGDIAVLQHAAALGRRERDPAAVRAVELLRRAIALATGKRVAR